MIKKDTIFIIDNVFSLDPAPRVIMLIITILVNL